MKWALDEFLKAIGDIFQAIFHAPAYDQDPTTLPMNQHPPSVPETTVVQPTKVLLDNFCLAIRDYEGKPGDKNWRNNNPGNCRFSKVGYASKYGEVKKDKDGFAIFKDYDTGFLYLMNLVRVQIKLHPEWTIYDYISKYHAPALDNNNPLEYTRYIARRLNVSIAYPIKNLV